ncbi:MAG: flagellar basal-body rod protein FlgG [Deltaproteobacteria bacterium]
MIRSLYTAATGMTAQQLDQDVVANNLANVNTVGFKRSRADFADLMYQIYTKAGSETSQGNQLPVGIEIGMGVKPVSTQKIFSQGDYQSTGNQYDLAIEQDGFFQFDNNGTIYYSRAGSLKINADGLLVNSEGLKFFPNITIPSTTVSFTVDSGGTWTALDSGGGSITGTLQLAKFMNPAGLASIGRNLFAQTVASGNPIQAAPGVDGMGTVSQRYLEMSNVSVIDEMVKMIVGQRAYEINSKAIQTADSMLSIINNLKR